MFPHISNCEFTMALIRRLMSNSRTDSNDTNICECHANFRVLSKKPCTFRPTKSDCTFSLAKSRLPVAA